MLTVLESPTGDGTELLRGIQRAALYLLRAAVRHHEELIGALPAQHGLASYL